MNVFRSSTLLSVDTLLPVETSPAFSLRVVGGLVWSCVCFSLQRNKPPFQNLVLPQHSCEKPPPFTSPLGDYSSPFSKKKRPISNAPTPSVLLPPPFKRMSLISTVQNFKASRSVSTDIFITVSNCKYIFVRLLNTRGFNIQYQYIALLFSVYQTRIASL